MVYKTRFVAPPEQSIYEPFTWSFCASSSSLSRMVSAPINLTIHQVIIIESVTRLKNHIKLCMFSNQVLLLACQMYNLIMYNQTEYLLLYQDREFPRQ